MHLENANAEVGIEDMCPLWSAGQRMGNTYGGFAGNGYGQGAATSYRGASSTAERVAKFARATRMETQEDQPQQGRQVTTYYDSHGYWQSPEKGSADWRKYGSTRKRR